ncbi:hypothetical protein CSC14_0385 [Proteus mirabilis]|nr:hypothetical protein CSC16_3620 [Proteus mirabilis]PVF71068.1 hypothetical protein CSC14_0385 [Proteus mirabilis]
MERHDIPYFPYLNKAYPDLEKIKCSLDFGDTFSLSMA